MLKHIIIIFLLISLQNYTMAGAKMKIENKYKEKIYSTYIVNKQEMNEHSYNSEIGTSMLTDDVKHCKAECDKKPLCIAVQVLEEQITWDGKFAAKKNDSNKIECFFKKRIINTRNEKYKPPGYTQYRHTQYKLYVNDKAHWNANIGDRSWYILWVNKKEHAKYTAEAQKNDIQNLCYLSYKQKPTDCRAIRRR